MTNNGDGGGICIQCALRRFVKELEAGLDPMVQKTIGPAPGWFEGTIAEHMAAEHNDPVWAVVERHDLEARAHAGFAALAERKAAAAQNN